MSQSDYKRVKHHQFPGDIPKSEKIIMRETGKLDGRSAKAWVKMLVARTRAILKRKTQEEVKQESGE